MAALEKRKYFEEVLNTTLEKVDIKLPEDSKLNYWVWQSCQWCALARRKDFREKYEKYWYFTQDK